MINNEFGVKVKNIKSGIIVLDSYGKITKCNKKAETLLKSHGNKLLGKYVFDLFPDINIEELQNEKCSTIDNILENKCLENKISTLIVKNGCKVEGIITLIFQNHYQYKILKEKKKDKEYIKELERIVERTYDGVVVVNKEGIITLLSKSYAEYLEVDAKKAIGRHVTEVIDNTRMHIVIKKGKIESTELQKINDKYIIATRIPIIEDGEVVGAVANVLFRNTRNYNLFYRKINKIEEKFHNQNGKKICEAVYSFKDIIGSSFKMERVKELSKKAACTNSSVLLRGESGTGKELFAHAIHKSSKRSSKNFVKVNCAAIPNELLESELFGYEKGSFTGASTSGKIGKFELADGGTIFLDEIGDMPLNMQVKLLRILQEREVEKIGSNNAKKIDIRIISATNRNLEDMIEEGRFREDLYYRLNVVEINIPPLRERKEDISLLVNHLIKKISQKLDKKIEGISSKAMNLLRDYNWEGNIRQLENVIERAINIVEDGKQILPEDLPSKITGIVVKENVEALDDILNKTEKKAISDALILCCGNKTKAAKKLNISRSTLYEKMNKHNMLCE